jgi:Flp pilus assembly protein TadG
MNRRFGRSGVAAMELALVSPVLVALIIASVDVGAAFLSKAQIVQAVTTAGEYATLAGQNPNKIASATIAANAKTYASAVSSILLGTPTVTVLINNGAATGSTCCVGSAWTCSTSTTFTCADGSVPGNYITITASYPYKAIFAADKLLTGKVLTDTIVARLS